MVDKRLCWEKRVPPRKLSMGRACLWLLPHRHYHIPLESWDHLKDTLICHSPHPPSVSGSSVNWQPVAVVSAMARVKGPLGPGGVPPVRIPIHHDEVFRAANSINGNLFSGTPNTRVIYHHTIIQRTRADRLVNYQCQILCPCGIHCNLQGTALAVVKLKARSGAVPVPV